MEKGLEMKQRTEDSIEIIRSESQSYQIANEEYRRTLRAKN